MMQAIAKLHMRALPHTNSSRRGIRWVTWLYKVVEKVGYVKTIKREGKIVGAMAGVGRLILTLVVDPEWQRKGVGRELLTQLPGKQWVYTEECSVGFYEKVGFRRVVTLGGLTWLSRK